MTPRSGSADRAPEPRPSSEDGRARFSADAKRRIGKVTLQVTSREAALQEVQAAILGRQHRVFAFGNANTITLAESDIELAQALEHATVFNDGVGVDIASKVLHGEKFPHNLNGTDFTPELLRSLKEPTRVFLVGSPPGVAEIAAANIESSFPMVRVVGVQHGFFADEEEDQIAQAIRDCGAELVLIGMGNPRQEIWAHAMSSRIAAVQLCIGAFIDFSAGRFDRAPGYVRRMRAEWLYRLAREPRRLLRRYTVGSVAFVTIIGRQRFGRP